MGTLMYGAGHVWAGRAHFYLHDHELSRFPPDESFIDMLKQKCYLSGPHFPPLAIVEALQDYVTNSRPWILGPRTLGSVSSSCHPCELCKLHFRWSCLHFRWKHALPTHNG